MTSHATILRRLALATVAALTVVVARTAQAQAPFTTEVLPVGSAQVRLDAQSHLAPRQAGGWVWTLPSVSVGIARGVEVGAGFSVVAPRPAGSATRDLTLTAKWAPLAGSKSPVQLAVGTFAFIPSERVREGARVPTMLFNYVAAGGAVLPALGDASPQLTLAGFTVTGPRVGPFGDRGGVMVALDQALPRSLARAIGTDVLLLKTNWVSGKTAFSYATASLIAVIGDMNVSVGYARGNLATANHGPMLGIGFQF